VNVKACLASRINQVGIEENEWITSLLFSAADQCSAQFLLYQRSKIFVSAKLSSEIFFLSSDGKLMASQVKKRAWI
jgi:hypothetical protein